MMNKRVLVCVAALAMVACDPEVVEPEDGGVGADSGSDASLEVCARNLDCDDGLYCTVHQCMPGVASADARGCVLVDGPCEAGQFCDEAAERCTEVDCSGGGDRDGDGRIAEACGGDDCDDDDVFRFVGAEEVCDAAGHDEDCDDETFARAAEADVDGDGFVTDQCCNGPNCGDDCAPNDRAIFPGARELCNGRDDDCDGVVDEETDLPLCPGGTCRGGYCDLQAWARTFGGAGQDHIAGVAMDGAGNVYVAGTFTGTASFGGAEGPRTAVGTGSIFVASYGADGRYRWARTYEAEGRAVDIAFDPEADLLYVVGDIYSFDFGSGTRSGAFILALDLDGLSRWNQPVGFPVVAVGAHNGAAVTGRFNGTVTTVGGTYSSSAFSEAIVTRFSATGGHRWDYTTASGELSDETLAQTLFIAPDGTIAVAGHYYLRLSTTYQARMPDAGVRVRWQTITALG